MPKLGLSDETAAALQTQWQDWVGRYLSLNIDIRLGFLEALSTFVSELKQQGGVEASKGLFDSLSSLFTAMMNLGGAVGKVNLAIVVAPLSAIVAAIGGYDNEDGDALIKFLNDAATWAAGSFIREMEETARVITVVADAINLMASAINLAPESAVAFFAGIANPDALSRQETTRIGEGDGYGMGDHAVASAGGAGRTIGRLLGRSELDEEDRRDQIRNQYFGALPSGVDEEAQRDRRRREQGAPAGAKWYDPATWDWSWVPGQAEGGVAMRKALRWIGEAGPEAIIPAKSNARRAE